MTRRDLRCYVCFCPAQEAVTVTWRASRITDRVLVCLACCQPAVATFRALGHDVLGVSDAA